MAQFVFGPTPQLQLGRKPLTLGTGGRPPPGYAWVTFNGAQVTFTGTINGVSYVNEPVYARAS